MTAGSTIASLSGHYSVTLTLAGSLVFQGPSGVIWSSNTDGSGAVRATMQVGGNLTLSKANGTEVWTSVTYGNIGMVMTVEDTGTLNLRTPGGIPLWRNGALTGRFENKIVAGQRLWAGQMLETHTGSNTLVMWPNGNLALFGKSGQIWASHSANRGAAFTAMQADGNLVEYNPQGQPVWSSSTYGSGSDTARVTTDGHFIIYGPGGTVWSNGQPVNNLPSTVGVYAYPSPTAAISAGWPIVGVTGALGTPTAPYVGMGYTAHNGNDEQVGFAIQNSKRNVPWLSFWTVSGPTPGPFGTCNGATPDQSPAAFYNDGRGAGAWVAHQIDSYASDGLHLKPTSVIFDPEGYPDNHSGLDCGISNLTGPNHALQIARWTSMLNGWRDGLHSVDPSLNPGVYSDQAEYTTYNLAASGMDAFIAVAFGYDSSAPAGQYPLIDPVRLSGVNGGNIKGVIAFFAGPPTSVECQWRVREANTIASWGYPLNTLQFDPGTYCAP
jgi:hypothetical protein